MTTRTMYNVKRMKYICSKILCTAVLQIIPYTNVSSMPENCNTSNLLQSNWEFICRGGFFLPSCITVIKRQKGLYQNHSQYGQWRIISCLTNYLPEPSTAILKLEKPTQCWNWPKRTGGSAAEMFEILPRNWSLWPIFTQKWAYVDMNWGGGFNPPWQFQPCTYCNTH